MGALRNIAFMLPALAWNILPAAAQNSTGDFNTQCADFAGTLQSKISNATIYFTEAVAAGTNLSLPDYDPSCGAQYQVVGADFCRVAMFVPTSERSNISMEVWLPPQEAWTGRFLSTGNGGISGCIQYYDLAYTVDLGFATVATNNGHNGTGGEAFFDNTEVVEDFAYRAMHTGVVVGKEVTQAFYGEAHKKSYYFGCSTGGRQGFKEAQEFPEDFDGLVVGAPALAFPNLTSWSGSFFVDTGTTNASTYVPLNLWAVIHQDILDQCDDLDGYVDGIIEDAGLCNYTISSSLLCSSGTNSTACLNDVQADTVRKIFSPVINAEDNSLVFPAMQPGSELLAQFIYYGGADFMYTTDWFRYVVYNDPTWDPATLDSADYTAAAKQNPYNIQTFEGDLSAVKDRGSKILHYHGQQDMIITSYNSPRYYEHVSETMGLDSSELDDFYRFFKIGGMYHCTGGPGATFIGQGIDSNATNNPDGNVLTAMVRWVEEGVAPDTILGTAYVNETATSGEIAFQRRHCKYPLRTVYSGSGDPTLPDSWTCAS
ncbi:Feruloyl esterase [Gnomoniopsis smithogilvyi]|uniref:Carboxylic ester hydrolase n=1 Tax=Gnomoniopsis smithogilvyi TaxID=1191159 RepID=A0A9W9CVA4_9PEZI|nr:Feruloyl esterase [Gnomoniopsis smithogilvyi]